MQMQEQLERRALAAHATAAGHTVDSQCECHVWKWLLHGALRLCASVHVSEMLCGGAAAAKSTVAVRAYPRMGRVVWLVSVEL